MIEAVLISIAVLFVVGGVFYWIITKGGGKGNL